ncbi:MAG: NADH-quinone oxidoreductase subunit D, partial [Thermoprotei archaeon]
IEKMLDEFREKYEVIAGFYEKDSTFRSRTQGVLKVPTDVAKAAGIVGPNARASGWKFDVRLSRYFAYEDVHFKPVVLEDGDIYARTMVRVKEVFESIRMAQEGLSLLKEGEPIAVKSPRNTPEGREAVFRTEAPRGELFYYVRGSGKPNPARMKVRTPTLATLRAAPVVLPGQEYQDVPAFVISIDPCICCTER